jgi:molybdopterin-dependent oxidoreductase alpha subunit
MATVKSGGGLPALKYSLFAAKKVGPLNLIRAMTRKNACKTCGLGMGGQAGGMTNELGHFPEVCKKSLQAQVADMQKPIPANFFQTHSIADLKGMTSRSLERAGRLAYPVYAAKNATHYQVVSWEFALDRIGEALKTTPPAESFFYFSGRSSNEAGFLLQLFARLYGTNHVNNCSFYCHQATGVGMASSIGSGTATTSIKDVENSDCFILFGANPASNHPRLMSSLMRLRRRGGSVIIINPVLEPGLKNFRVPSDIRSMLTGTEISSLYLQPNIGSDIPLMIGVGKLLIEFGTLDTTFINHFTEGWHGLQGVIQNTSWPDILRLTGLTRQEIERFAKIYSESKSTIFSWAMGLTHHLHGVENVQWVANLALLRGMIGKPGAGLLPLRGHSNIQGLGTAGVTPELKKEIFDRWEAQGIRVPTMQGFDTMNCMLHADRKKMRFGFCLGGNLFGSNPNQIFAERALSRVDTMLYLNTSLNTGHAAGLGKETIILPVAARDEEAQSTTQESMFSYVRLSDGGPKRIRTTKTEVEIICDLGKKVLGTSGPINWDDMQQHQSIRQLMGTLIPDLAGLGKIDEDRKEFQIPNRILHSRDFKLKGGRARLHAIAAPHSAEVASNGLRLMTVRSEGQFNTVVYETEDIYRGQTQRDIILMNENDIKKMGLLPNMRVTVKSSTGQMDYIAVRSWNIKEGNALMYYPEANILVDHAVDPKSGTPGFKCTLITIIISPELGH